MLYLRALEFEWRGANEARFVSPGQSMLSMRNQAQGTWTGAATALVEALKEDPSLHAAALHLGRIRMLQGQPLEATRLFRSALVSVDPAVAYLAALFLGSLEEREERFAEAEALYRDALARIPYGQAAPLALAQLLSRIGREAEARGVLAARLLRPQTFVVEPMWAYGPPDEDPATQIDLLRMEVWK
jgi:tetratricopeptide (TPR) repeat protein